MVEKCHPKADITAENHVAVRWASKNGDLDVVQYLVEKCQADITADNHYAVCEASRHGYLDVVEYLQEKYIEMGIKCPINK